MRDIPFLILFWLLALTACGDGSAQSGSGGVSAEDAAALDEAAAKLDAEAKDVDGGSTETK
ncbi:MAG: hypothetical protein WBO17_10315 [Sphingorhabdus sp.]